QQRVQAMVRRNLLCQTRDFTFCEAGIVIEFQVLHWPVRRGRSAIADEACDRADVVAAAFHEGVQLDFWLKRLGGDRCADHVASATAARPRTTPSTRSTPFLPRPFRLHVVPMSAPMIAATASQGR